MKRTIVACAVAAAMGGSFEYQSSVAPAEREPIAIERASMDGWLKGDSGPMLSAADPDVPLFHIVTQQRVEGADAVKALYAPYAGRPLFDSYRIDTPKARSGADMALLPYRLVTDNGGTPLTWNAAEVYRKTSAGWRVLHSHFSATGGPTP